jgi:hypothetical protein
MSYQKANKVMGLRNIGNYKILIVCIVLAAMAILCGMSETRVGAQILTTLPQQVGTLVGYGDFSQLHF